MSFTSLASLLFQVLKCLQVRRRKRFNQLFGQCKLGNFSTGSSKNTARCIPQGQMSFSPLTFCLLFKLKTQSKSSRLSPFHLVSLTFWRGQCNLRDAGCCHISSLHTFPMFTFSSLRQSFDVFFLSTIVSRMIVSMASCVSSSISTGTFQLQSFNSPPKICHFTSHVCKTPSEWALDWSHLKFRGSYKWDNILIPTISISAYIAIKSYIIYYFYNKIK